MKNNNSILSAFVLLSLATATRGLSAVNIEVLLNFSGTNGANPQAGVALDSAGNIFGTTNYGGLGGGVVYELSANRLNYALLANFPDSSGINGPSVGPSQLISDTSGNLYGTTYTGGAISKGSVFKIDGQSHLFSTLASFDNSLPGYPDAGLGLYRDPQGNFFGTMSSATVFELPAGSSTPKTLAAFSGELPFGPLVPDSAGNLYGVTMGSSANPNGSIFELSAPNYTSTTTVALFNGTNGSRPCGGLVADAAGNLYGTTTNGGQYDKGVIFKLGAGTHALGVLTSFSSTNGSQPFSGLIVDSQGNLFGTTDSGGSPRNEGTVFEYSPSTNQLSTLAAFDYATLGSLPYSGLTADAAGNLYGTTYWGGANEDGTIYEITGSGFVVPEPTFTALSTVSGIWMLGMRRRSRR